MAFPLLKWIIETIQVFFQFIFSPLYGAESLYQQSTQHQYYRDPEEDLDPVDLKKRMYDRFSYYGKFMKFSGEKAPPPHVQSGSLQQQQLTTNSPPHYNISLPRPHHFESEQARQRKGSHTNSAAPIAALHPSIKASPDARQRKQFKQSPHNSDLAVSPLDISVHNSNLPPNDPHRLSTVREEIHAAHTNTSPTQLPLTERTTDLAVGLRGSQPLITLDRFTILSVSRPDQQQSSMSSQSTQLNSNSFPPQPPNQQNHPGGHPAPVIPNNFPSPLLASQAPRRHDPSLPVIPYQDITFIQTIGTGGFGQVWKGMWKGTPVAVKSLNQVCQASSVPDKVLISFEEEVSMLARLRHPNICLLLGVCLEPSHRMIVTELVPRGSLWEALRIPNLFQSDGKFFWPLWVIKKVLEGAGRGLIYLHSHNPPIIHRDLKSPNLLLDESFNVKICDFGLAKLRDLTTILTANVGTVQWMAPEVLTGNVYSESADIYSLGLVMWEMLTGKCPYEGMKQVEIALAVVNTNLRPSLPSRCSQEQILFIQRCWSQNPQDRPSAEIFVQEINRVFVS